MRGEGVIESTILGSEVVDFTFSESFSTLEHHVFEEVGSTSGAWLF